MKSMEPESPDVLVVEDDLLVRNYLGRAVESAGLKCACTASAAEALKALRVAKNGPLAVLIDGMLPDVHGADLARQILNEPQWAATGICFVSGALRDVPIFKAGVEALVKPVHRTELLACLDRIREWRDAGGSRPHERAAVLAALTEQFMIAP
jgi:DNA-binding response OmpR family regulator